MKKYLQISLICFVLLSLFSCKPQLALFGVNSNPYWEGEVSMADGEVHHGLVQVPNSSHEGSISFKAGENSEERSLKRKEMSSLRVVSPTGQKYLFETTPICSTVKGKTSFGNYLLLVPGKNDYVTFYVTGENYEVNKKSGKIVLTYSYQQGKDLPLYNYYIRKEDKSYANMFGYTGAGYIGINAKLKKSARYNFQNDQSLLNQIEDGDLTHKDIPQIIAQYIEDTGEL